MDETCEGLGQVTQHDLDDEVIIYDPDLEQAHALNSTAAAVWRRIDGVVTEEQIVDLVAGEYGLSPADIAEDVGALLNDLEERALLMHRSPPSRRP